MNGTCRWAFAAASMLLAVGLSTSVEAGTSESAATVRHVAGEAAPYIGLIGDSTLSGVRWFEAYGELERFNFIFDAESCRRTIERSCWSREQYRPRNALTALEDEAGEWGEVLVAMTGYNDSAASFADGVEAIIDEAQRQGVGAVVWLSLRTEGVNYEEPLHLANGSTYRSANRSLYELAGQYGGYLQIADWATFSADSPDWFESDGAHLTPSGARAVTGFIASQVDAVLADGSITAVPPPWEKVRDGDEGKIVVDVQNALITAGTGASLVADGEFGPQTVAAVAAFQRTNGIIESGAVDGPTAAALGLYQPAATTSADLAPSTSGSVPSTVAATAGSEPDDGGGDQFPQDAWWIALVVAVAAAWVARRREVTGRSNPPSDVLAVESKDGLVTAMPYDYMRERDETAAGADLSR